MEINRCLKCMTNLAHGESVCPKCGTRVGEIEKQAISLAPETILHGKYYVGAVLGQGGFGITYIGFDMLLEIPVAIKEYFPSSIASRSGNTIQWHNTVEKRKEGFDSFLKEARKMAKLDGVSSVVRVREVFLENDTAYIVMDYIEGETLAGRLKREGVMSPKDCFALLRPIMEDMSRVHESGIIHRDIKPDNIMIRPDGKAMLLDLGAAKELTAAQIQEGKSLSSNLVVSQGFSPYEQYTTNIKIGPWTDVYSMCATVYYCVTGKVLPTAIDRMTETVETVFPAELGTELTRVLKKGMASKIADRIQTMPELIAGLDKVFKKPDDGGKKPKKNIPLIAAIIVLAMVGVFALGRRTPAAPKPTPGVTAKSIVDGSCGENATWALYEDGTLHITGRGEMTDFKYDGSAGKANQPWKNYYDKIKTVILDARIKKIGNYAFYGCTGLTSVTIPDSISSIGYSAFSDCTSLKSVTIPDSVSSIGTGAFSHCKSLASISISISVTSIGNSAFSDCTSLTSVTIPDSVSNIGGYAFFGCDSLEDIAYSGTMAHWNKISMGSRVWKYVSATVVHCTDGDIKL